jgi:hypothetical protein
MGTIVQLKKVRIAFIDGLFEPEQYEGKGDFRHTATFIVAPGSENDKAVQAAIEKEAQGAWNKKAASMLEDLRGDKKAFSYWKNKKSSSGNIYDGFENMYALSAVRKQKDGAPIFLHITKDPDTGKAKRLTGKEGVIYAGCYVNAKVEMWAQVGKYNGMRCGLLGVQFCDHGDSFGGASRPTDDGFDSVDAEDDLA